MEITWKSKGFQTRQTIQEGFEQGILEQTPDVKYDGPKVFRKKQIIRCPFNTKFHPNLPLGSKVIGGIPIDISDTHNGDIKSLIFESMLKTNVKHCSRQSQIPYLMLIVMTRAALTEINPKYFFLWVQQSPDVQCPLLIIRFKKMINLSRAELKAFNYTRSSTEYNDSF
jgi:hypothetical protein